MAKAQITASTKAKFTDCKLHIEQLRFSDKVNARPEDSYDEAHEGIEDRPGVGMPMPVLIATIEALGTILSPLIVHKLGKTDAQGRALFAVAAGGRRLRALMALWKGKRLQDPMIPCREVADADPMLVSLIENMAREPMNPVDECVAFGNLVERGQGVDAIAAAFGTSAHIVLQRLALAKLHPTLLEQVRARKIGMDAARAFASEPDAERQLAVWKKLPSYHKGSAHAIREALVGQDLRAGDRLARFVTLDAYRAAGGELREDLFATQGTGDEFVLTDPGLVETLAAAKLHDKAEGMKAQGWSWVEPVMVGHAFDVQRLARERGLVRCEARGADRAKAGYFTYCDGSGHLQVDGPYMVKKEARAQERAKAAGAGDAPQPEARIPESLMVSLTAHKSAALQCALLSQPAVTLALLASSVVQDYSSRDHLQVRFESQRHHIERNARGFESTRPARVLAEVDALWEGRIPDDVEPFAWFLSQPESVSVEAIVWATARAFTITNPREGSPDGVEQLQAALKFSLADHFKPTVDTYFGQITKPQIIKAVVQACGDEAAAPLEGMKKDALAAAAEQKVADKEWIPEIMR